MPERGTVRLTTRSELPSAEITVLDGKFQFVHRAVGSLDLMLAPGVYTIQFRSGSAAADVPVVLRPGSSEVTLSAPPLQMKSPAPIAGNKAGDMYGETARECSSTVHASFGKGGQLFVFLRLATTDLEHAQSLRNKLCEVTVLNVHGDPLADLRYSPQRAADGTSVGCNVELEPGTYMLRYEGGDVADFEQSFVVSKGWQTQVFASSHRCAKQSEILAPNLAEAAVFMVKQGRGFQPVEAAVAWTESARQALAQGGMEAPRQQLMDAVESARQIRESAPPEAIGEMLSEKFVNPMLGIYAAHLLLQSAEPHWDLLREVVRNLRSLVGPHPDVTALTLLPQLEDLREGDAYAAPPMLNSSWKLIVAASVERPELVPIGSYAESMATRVWASSAWLVWQQPSQDALSMTSVPDVEVTVDYDKAIEDLRHAVSASTAELGLRAYIEDVAKKPGLSDAERAVLVYLASTSGRSRNLIADMRSLASPMKRLSSYLQDTLAKTGWVKHSVDVQASYAALKQELQGYRLVRTLGLPAGSLRRAVASLAKKFPVDVE